MVLGLSIAAFTALHVAISLIGIATGLVVVGGLLTRRPLPAWTAGFLAATVLTSVTGFMFPSEQLGPPHLFGVVSLVALVVAIVARYPRRMAGRWRATWVLCALLALYLNAFVGVVQAFQKLPALNALAPTQQEPPFALAQAALLALFVAAGVLGLRRFRPGPG